MKFELDSRLIEPNRRKMKEALVGKRVYVCMGNYLLLNAFCLTRAINDRLVGHSTTEQECISDLVNLKPDLLFITEYLESGCAASLVEKAKSILPGLKTLVFIDSKNVGLVDKCVDAGSEGIIFTTSIGTINGNYVEAIVNISEGNTYFPIDVRQEITPDNAERLNISELSQLELDVLKLVTEGNSDIQIAKVLSLREASIKKHIINILQKLGIKHKTQLMVARLKNKIHFETAS